jgi:hypothetical protein
MMTRVKVTEKLSGSVSHWCCCVAGVGWLLRLLPIKGTGSADSGYSSSAYGGGSGGPR